MRFISTWCCILAAVAAQSRRERFYAPQTFDELLDPYRQSLFVPASNEITPRNTNIELWRPDVSWKSEIASTLNTGPVTFSPAKPVEPWKPIVSPSKEQQAAILYHKQALSSEGNFRFEYASDNGLAAGEVIEPDGTRLGAYQYKDPSGQIIKVKYRAGKEGFQILEGSHVPKSVEPQEPPRPESHYKQAYDQQKRQYELQQNYNQIRLQQPWSEQRQNYLDERDDPKPTGGQYFLQNRHNKDEEDDGQYRENDLEEDPRGKRPHTFGAGYAFSFA